MIILSSRDTFVSIDVSKLPGTAFSNAAVIVAHPDDETLWAGGTILSHPLWHWHIVTLCRASDQDRASRFLHALQRFGATGAMADLDDGPDQFPLNGDDVQAAILSLLPTPRFGLILSHDPAGEYTRHLRHEEVAQAVISLWAAGRLATEELWTFAYEDGGKQYLPRAVDAAPIHYTLPDDVWQQKRKIMAEVYGFPPDGFEVQTTPRVEAFWRFGRSSEALNWLKGSRGKQ